MATFKEIIISKLPGWNELFPVFSVIIFFTFSWSFYRIFYMVPSWTGYMNMQSVIMIGAYVVSFALFESIFFLIFLLLWSLILPTSKFRENFTAIGSAISALTAISAFLLQRKVGIILDMSLNELIIYPIIILFTFVIAILIIDFIFDSIDQLSKLAEKIAELMIIFAILYIPLGLIGLVIVIFRNVI